MRLEKLGNWLMDLLFPPRCPWCDTVLAPNEQCSCGGKREEYRYAKGELDLKAANQNGKYVNKVWASFRYEGKIRQAMLRFKFESEPALAVPFGEEMVHTFTVNELDKEFDILVPIPVSKKTLDKRGYNQTLLLAKEVAKATGMPCVEALYKCKETKPQRDLEREERKTNIAGAFIVEAPHAVAGKRVLLVDDIITTGSTLNEAAKVLLQAGAVECGALCFASTEKPLA